MPEKNIPALKKLRATLIQAHANEALEMMSWASRHRDWAQVAHPEPGDCGTALCAASWAAVNAGWTINWNVGVCVTLTCRSGSKIEYIENVAIKELGLTFREANVFFNCNNPDPEEPIERSEVLRSLDGLITLAERFPHRTDVEDALDTERSRAILCDLADNPDKF